MHNKEPACVSLCISTRHKQKEINVSDNNEPDVNKTYRETLDLLSKVLFLKLYKILESHIEKKKK